MGGSLLAVLAALVLFAAPDHAEQEAIDKLIDDLEVEVDQGDSIVVSEKLLETRLMEDLMDIIQITCRIAVTTGVLIPAF